MAARESVNITSTAQSYMAFLRTAANNYKYDFRDQILIHAQNPSATACAEIEVWNKLGRWVNKGTKGIALLVDGDSRYKLRHVFDVADTNSYYGRTVSLWQMKPRYESEVTEALRNKFGEMGDNGIFESALFEAAELVVEDNYSDYLSQLEEVKDASLLGELDDLNTSVWLRTTLKTSVAYMLFVRCGYDTHRFFEPEDFSHIRDFDTPETISILGTAASDISEMVLREIGVTVKTMEQAEKKQNRTFAKQPAVRHNETARRQISSERSFDNGADVQSGGRLPAAEPDRAGEPDAGQIRDAAPELPSGAEEGPLHGDAAVRETERASGADRPAGGGNDGAPDSADGEGAGRDRVAESDGSDALGADDEQHQELSGGNGPLGADLQLSGHDFNHSSEIPYFHETNEKNELLRSGFALKKHRQEITAFFASHVGETERGDFIKSFFDNAYNEMELKSGTRAGYKAYADVLHLWRGKYLSREKEDYLRWPYVANIINGMILMDEWLEQSEKPLSTQAEQISLIEEAEAEKVSAFSLPQEAIDYILCHGSSYSEGKFRILEHFALKLSVDENARFLKQEYGTGGHSDAIPGSSLWENHDSKGITISRGYRGNEDYVEVVLRWPAVAKRIGELIAADRYLNTAEREAYPAYRKGEEDRAVRNKIASEFRSLIYDYNDYWTQLKEPEKCLNLHYLSGCWTAFSMGEKKMYERTGNGDFILPMMREALTGIISEGTHHQERAEALYESLNSDPAMRLEPTSEEMNPPPESEKEYHISLGDTVYLGAQEYEVLVLGDDTVRLYDPSFPMFNKELPRDEFDSKLRENPLNDRYTQATNLQTDSQQESFEESEKPAEKESSGNPVWDEYRSLKAQQPEDVLLYQTGDFFIVLGDDAEPVSQALDLMLTSRSLNAAERIPMCGVPVSRLETYINMLTDRGYGVAVADLDNGERRVIRLSPQRDTPVESFPVGRIEYLGSDGNVGETIEYVNGTQLVKDIKDENHYGAPMRIVVYRQEDGSTIPLDFVQDLDPPPQGFDIIDTPAVESVPTDETPEQSAFEAPVSGVADRFHVVELDRGAKTAYGIWDDEADALYTDDEGVTEEFGGEWEADAYLEQLQGSRVAAKLKPIQPAVLEPPKPKHKEKARSTVLYPDIQSNYRTDYRIENDELGVGTPLHRYERNIMAIQLLHKLEEERRLATPTEQSILVDYVGWGGLADFFDERNSRYEELKALLTEDEYASARESTLTAFYTPPVVIRAMYQALDNLGFKTGNLLEPSCGIGNFIGMKPEKFAGSKIYGVELDSISGRIAQQLYQNASVAVQGFEKAELPDSFFDVAIGNIPFGSFKLSDKRYDKYNLLIHDYFFAKTLDKVRPGGIVAFITSKGTMDKESPVVRKYIAQRADLLGAIRLPNDTFKAAAGTEVTSDILFFQKRDRLIDKEPDWVHLNTDENGVKMNQYFIDNPDMILGEMQMVSGPYGPESACVPYDGQELEALLTEAVQNITGQITEYEMDELSDDEEDHSIPADPSVRNFSYTVVDGKIYYRENSRMVPIDAAVTAENRIKGMIAIRDSVRTLIEYQTEDFPDEMIADEQKRLNELYDTFSAKYGIINSRANKSVFNSDSSFCLLSSLEVLDDEGAFVRKADMFTRRTIKQRVVITSVDTASEALAVSLAEKAKVDMPFMMELTGKTEEAIASELHGVIFLNPLHTSETDGRAKYLPADEYLSGNVREKLEWAKRSAILYPEDYAANVQALEAVQPKDLSASDISVRLGATWIPPEIIEKFIFELFDTPRYCQWNIHVHYAKYTGEWNIEGKSYDRGNINSNSTYGTDRINGYKIVEQTLNLKDVRIFDYIEDAEGRKTPVLNKKETAIAQGKQELIKQAFADWIWADPQRRNQLCSMYNVRFNSIRPREYDGSHLNLVGINPEIRLRQHQLNAVARGLYGGNELLGHVVGAGKTFTMVAIAQESKRLGLARKSLIVVPNHLTEQWSAEYLQLYPSANILVATAKDFEAKNRKRFCARIATGDYDAIIIGHSQLEKIPMSIERQRYILEQQVDEIMAGIMELKSNRGDRFSIKQLERSKKAVLARIEKLNDQSRKDDLVTFEELGVDRLMIDEAHYYKNLAAFTKMRNVGGISQTEAMKSSDLYMKCRYLDELTGGKGVIFATGTPISNTMVEMYTMQKYLQYDMLRQNDLIHFDAWASTFGETVTAIELAPEGTGYRAKTRFARFYNLPELMSMFKETADIQTADMLKLPVPKANYHNIALKPSPQQVEMVASLAARAERVRNRMVNSSVDNMLVITNDGRKLALDQRLMNELLPDSPTSKVSACAANVFEIWQRTADKRSTQMVFSDLSTPKGDDSFNVYDALRDKLIAMGIPEQEIAYIHNAGTETKKKELFGKVRSGQVRVIIGSTQKMGAGTNIQTKLFALHHLDCPWRPADLQQREGRIIRQGNENPEVEIFTYVTENTFDSYLYQLVESKQKFIGQIMTSKSPVRSAEDIDETALSYAEIKALCAGDERIREKMNLDTEVQKLKLLKANHLSQRYALEDQIIKEFPQKISSLEQRIEGFKSDMTHLAENSAKGADGFCTMEVEGKLYTEKKDAGYAILAACKAMTSPDAVPLGRYRGFAMELSFDSFSREYKITLKNALHHTTALGTDVFGNIQRLDNLLEGFGERLTACEEQLENTRVQLKNAQEQVKKPFPREDELREKTARLDELNIMLNMDKRENELADDEREEDEPSGRSTKEMER
jgi:N12 class adenine-specific DNA methylase